MEFNYHFSRIRRELDLASASSSRIVAAAHLGLAAQHLAAIDRMSEAREPVIEGVEVAHLRRIRWYYR